MITRQVEGYWLAEQYFNGRTLLAEGETRAEARAGLYEMIERHYQFEQGRDACKSALANGLSVWRREVCPFDEGTPQRQGWVKYVSEQARELRVIMGAVE